MPLAQVEGRLAAFFPERLANLPKFYRLVVPLVEYNALCVETSPVAIEPWYGIWYVPVALVVYAVEVVVRSI